MIMRNCNFHDTDGPGFLLCCYASDGHPNMGIVMENCVINAKSKRPLQPRVRAAIINTTDWTEASWNKCRFYLSKGEGIMTVMDREKDKRSTFKDCFVKNLSAACSSPKHPAQMTEMAAAAGATGPTFLLDFGRPVSINEFKLKEDPASGISRYIIETWDDKKSQWKSCFNGMGIGGEFVCAIVPQTTSKARLRVIANRKEKTVLTAFDAYNDPQGDALNVARGGDTPNRPGK
jgi:hypothetical protein